MRKLFVAGLAALAIVVPSSAHAVIFLGARVGYALPSGDIDQGTSLRDSVSANVPIQLDAGLSFLSILSFGVYGSYGPSRLANVLKDSAQCSGVSCKGQQLRFGVQLNASPPVVLKSLWGGLFAGFEQQQLSAGSDTFKFRGWEAGLQGGYDFSVLPFVRVGPFASYAIAQFTSASGGAFFHTKSQHTALTFGLRGLFDF